jgi:Predicted xylanase/chitin deacetylase
MTMRIFRAAAILILMWLGTLLSRDCLALVVLQYHHISAETPPATSISPERFAQHMAWLAENQYQILSMPDLLDLLRDKKALPDKAAVITFDDGYTSIYSAAWPMLRKYNWPFTVFVNSQHHDEKNPQYMSWEQLREMAKTGVTIGNHSISHTHMIRRQAEEKDADWLARSRREIVDAQKRIDAELGRQLRIFAYPFGEHNRALEALLKELGYIAFAQHSGAIAPFDSVQALPRFPFGGNYGDMKDFALKASSLPMPIKKAALLDENRNSIPDPLVADKAKNATLVLEGDADFLKKISCFYIGEAAMAKIREGELHVTTSTAIPSGRSKFNCTAPEKGRFYWFSKMLIKKNGDGSWYKE